MSDICKSLGINLKGISYTFAYRDHTDEYDKAELAYKDAYKKAMLYCKLNNQKLVGIKYIDDYTVFNAYSKFTELSNWHDRAYKDSNYLLLESFLSSFTSINLQSLLKNYSLKVVFEVE